MRNFICKQCNTVFNVEYPLSSKRILIYCSKSCKSLTEGFTIKHDKEKLYELIKAHIKNKNAYCTLESICKKVSISSKTLTKYNISISKINEDLGFFKPKSKFEEDVYTCLKNLLLVPIIREKTFDNLLSEKGYKLRFDFYMKDLNLIVEADGNQHYNKSNPRYSDYLNISDSIKNQHCKDYGLTLIRIPYKRFITNEYILNFLKDYSTNLS